MMYRRHTNISSSYCGKFPFFHQLSLDTFVSCECACVWSWCEDGCCYCYCEREHCSHYCFLFYLQQCLLLPLYLFHSRWINEWVLYINWQDNFLYFQWHRRRVKVEPMLPIMCNMLIRICMQPAVRGSHKCEFFQQIFI